jgi:hypothetical protein
MAGALEMLRTGSGVPAFPAEGANANSVAAPAKAKSKMFGVNIIISSITRDRRVAHISGVMRAVTATRMSLRSSGR